MRWPLDEYAIGIFWEPSGFYFIVHPSEACQIWHTIRGGHAGSRQTAGVASWRDKDSAVFEERSDRGGDVAQTSATGETLALPQLRPMPASARDAISYGFQDANVIWRIVYRVDVHRRQRRCVFQEDRPRRKPLSRHANAG